MVSGIFITASAWAHMETGADNQRISGGDKYNCTMFKNGMMNHMHEHMDSQRMGYEVKEGKKDKATNNDLRKFKNPLREVK